MNGSGDDPEGGDDNTRKYPDHVYLYGESVRKNKIKREGETVLGDTQNRKSWVKKKLATMKKTRLISRAVVFLVRCRIR